MNYYSLNLNSEDEDLYDLSLSKVESNLYYLLLFSTLSYIIAFFFFGCWATVSYKLNPNFVENIAGVKITLSKFIICILGVLFNLIYTISFQKRVINFKKEINPLLKGSLYDINFSKKWLESSDEALKLSIYKGSFKSHNVTNITCFILLALLISLNQIINTGIIPIFIILIILLAQNIAYYSELIKASKIKKIKLTIKKEKNKKKSILINSLIISLSIFLCFISIISFKKVNPIAPGYYIGKIESISKNNEENILVVSPVKSTSSFASEIKGNHKIEFNDSISISGLRGRNEKKKDLTFDDWVEMTDSLIANLKVGDYIIFEARNYDKDSYKLDVNSLAIDVSVK